MKLDVEFVRSQFPAFDHVPAKQWAFFENAGGSYVCRQVVDRLHAFMTEYKAQPYGPSWMATRAGEAMDSGYAAIAGILGTRRENLTLGPSTTANLYVLAHALRPGLVAGDEIVVTNQDHEANIGCWRRLEEFGVVVREWRVDKAGELQLGDLERLVCSKTRVVCFSLSSNIIGTQNPVGAIAGIAKQHGALVVGDAVSFAPHWIPEVEASGLDFFLFSAYKTFGTHIGVMWGSDEGLARTTSQGHYFNEKKPNLRLNPTGPLHAEIAALEGVGTYIDTLYGYHFGAIEESLRRRTEAVFELVKAHEIELTQRLLERLAEVPGIRVVGAGTASMKTRSSVVSIRSDRIAPAELARRLAEREIAVGTGHFYAARLLEALGLDPERGVLRVSMVHYNTPEEVDRLTEALGELLAV
ncbi:MAG: aminotransferase class V-fold PLP-dependent enzyme [Thermoanaerobaculia bacterium]